MSGLRSLHRGRSLTPRLGKGTDIDTNLHLFLLNTHFPEYGWAGWLVAGGLRGVSCCKRRSLMMECHKIHRIKRLDFNSFLFIYLALFVFSTSHESPWPCYKSRLSRDAILQFAPLALAAIRPAYCLQRDVRAYMVEASSLAETQIYHKHPKSSTYKRKVVGRGYQSHTITYDIVIDHRVGTYQVKLHPRRAENAEMRHYVKGGVRECICDFLKHKTNSASFQAWGRA